MAKTLPKPRRRVLRFSLRAMLLLVVVIGAALSWTMHKVRQQAKAVAALEGMGCTIDYDDSGNPPSVLESLRKLLTENEPRNVAGVYAGESMLTDSEMAHLQPLTSLWQIFKA
jgi:hypothetical protein